jgi:hypothetical protein
MWHLPQMGLWDSIAITVGFSLLVVAVDEVIHWRRRKQREREGRSTPGH